MNAGQALGLLAGLGAVNALGGGRLEERLGGRAATGKRFTGLLDMLDGGGAGASGDKFEGGGLVSMLGNLFAKPLQAQERVERIAKVVRDEKAAPLTSSAETSEKENSLLSAALANIERQRGLQQDLSDPRDQQGATAFRTPQASDYPSMSMPYIEGYTAPTGAASEETGLLSGNQAVPSMVNYNPSVPSLLAFAQDRDFLSPVVQQDYADYLEYLNTGRYPRD